MLARGVYPLYRIAGAAATGGIYAAPTNQTIIFALPFDRGRGMPRPSRAVVFYCPVGRGDPTPPCGLPVISHCPDDRNGRSMTAPTSLSSLICPCAAYIYVHCKNIFSTFFVAFQRAKTGDFRRRRARSTCIFLQGLYNKQYVPSARANVVFYGHSVERKERNFGYGCNFQGM